MFMHHLLLSPHLLTFFGQQRCLDLFALARLCDLFGGAGPV
jgi:hypothetical protein